MSNKNTEENPDKENFSDDNETIIRSEAINLSFNSSDIDKNSNTSLNDDKKNDADGHSNIVLNDDDKTDGEEHSNTALDDDEQTGYFSTEIDDLESSTSFTLGSALNSATNKQQNDSDESQKSDIYNMFGDEPLTQVDETAPPLPQQSSMFKEKKLFGSTKNFKLGIVGSKGVGKSYLFHAMVYRLQNTANSGALSYFVKDSNISISGTIDRDSEAEIIPFTDFIENYIDWRRLAPTREGTQKWYRLSIPYKSGFFGTKKKSLDVEFFDGAGEIYSAGDSTSKKYWEQNFKDTSVIVFCLPLWVAFPNKKNKNSKERRDIISGFNNVVTAYQELRKSENIKVATKSILALTMSDDVENTSFESDLVESWLAPYTLDDPNSTPDLKYFKKMNSGGSVNRYLANARKVSNTLNDKLKNSGDVLVANIPNSMDFDAGSPWIIPLSAVRGDFLKQIEDVDSQYMERPEDLVIPDHNPAHVELPLLVALCEHTNALM